MFKAKDKVLKKSLKKLNFIKELVLGIIFIKNQLFQMKKVLKKYILLVSKFGVVYVYILELYMFLNKSFKIKKIFFKKIHLYVEVGPERDTLSKFHLKFWKTSSQKFLNYPFGKIIYGNPLKKLKLVLEKYLSKVHDQCYVCS